MIKEFKLAGYKILVGFKIEKYNKHFDFLPDKPTYNCEVGFGPKVMQELDCANSQVEVNLSKEEIKEFNGN